MGLYDTLTKNALFDTLQKNAQKFATGAQSQVKKLAAYRGEAKIPLISLTDTSASNNKIYNIVEDYKWTLTPKANRLDVPYIELIEYEQDISTIFAQLAYWANSIKTSESQKNPYENLYHALPTGTSYIFPYFEPYDHQTAQNWQTTKGLAEFSYMDKILNIAGNIAKGLQLAPGTTVNQPQVWKGPANLCSYTINFKLFNTDVVGDIIRNQQFKERLLMATLHDQQSIILSSPPAIYTVNIPGIRYSPAAVISQLNINNIGQMNLINGYNVPDAYEFQIQILELINESRQILDAAIGAAGQTPEARVKSFNKVRAITDNSSVVIQGKKNLAEQQAEETADLQAAKETADLQAAKTKMGS